MKKDSRQHRRLLRDLAGGTICVVLLVLNAFAQAPPAPSAAPAQGNRRAMPRVGGDAARRAAAAAAAENKSGVTGISAVPAGPSADKILATGAYTNLPVRTGIQPADLQEPSGKVIKTSAFEDSPLDMILMEYERVTGKTLLLAPGLPKINVTLVTQREDMPIEDYLLAIRTLLNMNGVALVPVSATMIKVVPSKDLASSGIEVNDAPVTKFSPEDGQHTRRMMVLKHIAIDEAKKAVEPFKSPAGQIQLFERTNSVLLMDTVDNVNRMMQIIEYIDQPIARREEANVRQIRYAKAVDIKKMIDTIVAEAKKAEGQNKGPTTTVTPRASGSPGMARRTVPGVIRPTVATPVNPSNPTISALVDEAARGIISGEVQTVADERTNILILITRPENMKFFNRIIDVLDVETSPDVVVEVLRLEFADAEEISSMLNDLIGNKSKDSGPNIAAAPGDGAGKSAPLRDFVPPSRQSTPASEAKKSLGELDAENIKILADKRTNALVVMASKSDLATIREVVKGMDIMLSQVLIEVVILEISLGDGIEAGVDWIQRSRVLYDNGVPTMGYAGSSGSSGTRPTPALAFDTAANFPVSLGSGLSYYLTFFDLNIDMIVRAAMNDSKTHIHSTPVVMTQDNKEAEIKATRQIYVYKGKKYAGDASGSPVYEDDVERQDVGLTLTVTPRINENRFVVMNVKQAIENVGGKQIINETEWPIITKREIGADIAVESGETIVLGGLVLDNRTENTRKVPILGSIPILGWLFKSKSVTTSRDEVVVFLTPYVLNTPEEIRAEAVRRRDSVDASGWNRGWTGSKIAPPTEGHRGSKTQEDEQKTTAEPGFGIAIPESASADIGEGDDAESVE